MTQNRVQDGTQVVAIDGPAGAGKSSVARAAAQVLGLSFLDTGAMYRAATLRAMRQGVPLDDSEALARCTAAMTYEQQESDGGTRILLDGEDVSESIRSPEVTRNIQHLDQIAAVRQHLVALQRDFGLRQPTVAEGRDMGTVVFPRSRCKIYMDASLECRVMRRALEMEAKGLAVNRDLLLQEMKARDDSNIARKESPLRPAEDAVLLDTTAMTKEQVIDTIVNLARERLAQ